MHSLKRKLRHFGEITITGCTVNYLFYSFWCSQWWEFRHDGISVPCFHLRHMQWSNKIFGFTKDYFHINEIYFSLQVYGTFMLNRYTMFCQRQINYVSAWQLNNSSPVYGLRCARRSYKRLAASPSPNVHFLIDGTIYRWREIAPELTPTWFHIPY